MSREIYTYTDLTRIGEWEEFKKIKQYPQIAVSADLRKGLTGKMDVDYVDGILSKDSTVRIAEFHKLSSAIDKEWKTQKCKFDASVLINSYLRQMLLAEEDESKKNWLRGCIRNVSSLRSSIEMLEEARVNPEDIDAHDDRNIQLLKEIWKEVKENSESIKQFQDKMEALKNKDAWKRVFVQVFGTDDFDTVVFHGFYYFTPYQDRVVNLLEEAGYNIIFLFPYDERFPFAYEIWDKTYTIEKGYPAKEKWHSEKSEKRDSFGDIFEGKKSPAGNKLEIREYASVMEFVDDIHHIKERGYAVYSPAFIQANQLLQDYFPEEFGERKILSYPIGQFISVINKMWDTEKQAIVLDEDSLIECFSSGWLAFGGVSAKQYMQDLFNVLPFFRGCFTLDEWQERTEKLEEIRRDAIEPFEKDLDDDDNTARWQMAMGNPLASISTFSVESDRLDIIINMIKSIFDIARELFGNGEKMQVSEYVAKLNRVLKAYEMSSELYQEERELIGEIFKAISQTNGLKTQCSPGDIASAVNLFIYGRYDEGEIQTNKVGLVYPMYFVDAACVKNKSRVHVCMCDSENMPGGIKEQIWPLTGSCIKEAYDKTQNTLIQSLLHVIESAPLCNRYFMYCALKNKDVGVSWIREIDGKYYAPSPYIKLVCEATGIDIRPPRRRAITYERVQEAARSGSVIKEYDIDKMPLDTIKDARMDYALCPIRYILGYVLEKYPVYQSDFQQRYAVNAVISAIYGLMKNKGISIEEVYDQVISIFPTLRKVERRQIKDYIGYDDDDTAFLTGRTETGKKYYTDERLRIQYPNTGVRKKAMKSFGMLATPDGRTDMDITEDVDSHNQCMFCPHASYCKNAIYFEDGERFYG